MTTAGSVYGHALYELAKAEGMAKPIWRELSVLNRSFSQEPDFLRLLATPSLSKEERCAILDSSFRGKLHPYVLNFLKILTQKGYSKNFSVCCAAYRQRYHLDSGILTVQAVTAVPLTPTQSTRLTEKLETITGKTIELGHQTDPSVLGGIRLDYDGKQLDDTVAHRINAIRGALLNTAL